MTSSRAGIAARLAREGVELDTIWPSAGSGTPEGSHPSATLAARRSAGAT